MDPLHQPPAALASSTDNLSSSAKADGFPGPHSAYCRVWKRFIDLVGSLIGLILLFPFLILVGLLVKCSSRGPALYWQVRVGLDGQHFRIAKFRSMVAGAERIGPAITSSGDARITQLGSLLRKCKVDELPQLWNVLKGEMSLVGPRPELPRYVAEYSEREKLVLSVRPGITDPASIRYRHEEQVLAKSGNPEEFYKRVVLRDKLALNLGYVRQISFALDMRILLQTLRSLFV
jgi:lipopolysaccharide/colanic/teichoic acid biosynthesis glycosyltransferase